MLIEKKEVFLGSKIKAHLIPIEPRMFSIFRFKIIACSTGNRYR